MCTSREYISFNDKISYCLECLSALYMIVYSGVVVMIIRSSSMSDNFDCITTKLSIYHVKLFMSVNFQYKCKYFIFSEFLQCGLSEFLIHFEINQKVFYVMTIKWLNFPYFPKGAYLYLGDR